MRISAAREVMAFTINTLQVSRKGTGKGVLVENPRICPESREKEREPGPEADTEEDREPKTPIRKTLRTPQDCLPQSRNLKTGISWKVSGIPNK